MRTGGASYSTVCLCAKQLQAKIDGGDALMVKVSQGWAAATPAANVLETTHKLLAESR